MEGIYYRRFSFLANCSYKSEDKKDNENRYSDRRRNPKGSQYPKPRPVNKVGEL